jgi:hypothetical protein
MVTLLVAVASWPPASPFHFWGGIGLSVLVILALASIGMSFGSGSAARPQPGQSSRRGRFEGDYLRFRTRVRGVQFQNRDGSRRQAFVRRCRAGDRLQLVQEPDNPVDPCAVLVLNHRGQALGYLGADTAAWLSDAIDDGIRYHAIVLNRSGGPWPFKHYGLNIEVRGER